MEQPVQDGGEDLVVEDLAPVDEALVARDDQTRPLVAADQEGEEQAGFLTGSVAGNPTRSGSGRGGRRAAASSGQGGSRGGSGPAAHQTLQREEQDGVPRFYRLHPEADGQMRFAQAQGVRNPRDGASAYRPLR